MALDMADLHPNPMTIYGPPSIPGMVPKSCERKESWKARSQTGRQVQPLLGVSQNKSKNIHFQKTFLNE